MMHVFLSKCFQAYFVFLCYQYGSNHEFVFISIKRSYLSIFCVNLCKQMYSCKCWNVFCNVKQHNISHAVFRHVNRHEMELSLPWRYFHLNTSKRSEMRGRNDHTPRECYSSHLLLTCSLSLSHSLDPIFCRPRFRRLHPKMQV